MYVDTLRVMHHNQSECLQTPIAHAQHMHAMRLQHDTKISIMATLIATCTVANCFYPIRYL